jgi:glycosyltransferase involved in cell wall biosynthesis
MLQVAGSSFDTKRKTRRGVVVEGLSRSLAAAPVMAIVVPCLNEQDVLPEAVKRLVGLLDRLTGSGEIHRRSRVWFVDDGSSDRTWSIISDASVVPDSTVCGIKLSRNRGHQIALLAGLMNAKGDVLVTIDADLQDDLEAIPRMLEEYRNGADIVYGVRASRNADTLFKRLTAEGYYRLLDWLDVEVVFNHADFRLMSRRAVEALRQFPESNVFLRGMIPHLGFRSSRVEYTRGERFAGESKYPVGKMVALAWQGVTSFSTAPLRVITALGLAVSALSLAMALWAIFVRFFTDLAIPGWASIVIPIFLISGVQLLSLGVIGEYLAKIFLETKRRPLYLVDEVVIAGEAREDASAAAAETDRGRGD